MKYRIKYLPDSATDRSEIKAYLAQYYESTVKNFFALLKKKIERLKEYPYSCPAYEGPRLSDIGSRGLSGVLHSE